MLSLRTAGRRISSRWAPPRQRTMVVLSASSVPPQGGMEGPIMQRSLTQRDLQRVQSYSSKVPDVPHIKVALPALSPTMEVGTIVSWEKKEGEQLSEGDLLCEIETDKATMGFETPEEGYLAKVLLPSGSKDVPIGQLLCIIVENEEDISKFKDFVDDGSSTQSSTSSPPASTPSPQSTPLTDAPPPAASLQAEPRLSTPKITTTSSPALSTSSKRPFASPAAKRIASEKGIDISQISSGSGMDGMIVAADVEAFKQPSLGIPSTPGLSSGMLSQGSHTDAELSSMRRTIAKRLQSSKHEIPHYYLSVEIAMDSVMALRKEINAKYEGEGIKLSLNDFIIKATALASRRVPTVNSSWMGESIREYHNVDVSVAVDTGSGLITPIVASAESKGLAEISESIKEMAGRAKEGKLQPHEFMGGTITVSNLGMFGISHFTAIINPPQSCILAVGGTTKKAIALSDGSLGNVNVMKVTLSCDHRVVDGAVGAQWLQHFKKFIENPTAMLL